MRRLGVDRSSELSPKPSMVAERRRAPWSVRGVLRRARRAPKANRIIINLIVT